MFRRRTGLRRSLRPRGEGGLVTAEWALVLMAGVAFAAVLLKVVTSGSVRSALEGMVSRALAG